MPPNTVDEISYTETEEGLNRRKVDAVLPSNTVPETATTTENRPITGNVDGNYSLQILQSTLNLIAHILIGVTVGILLTFSFRQGLPLGATSLHIVLCVTGYQLLMSQAILSFSTHNGWSSKLKFMDKKRAHAVLQTAGSSLAMCGSFIKILDKTAHWNSLHGQFALVALVFTSVCLFNGLASYYSFELRGMMPVNISKITHICFGIIAFVAATITLCYGINKNMFRTWATGAVANTLIAFAVTFTLIIIINPLINLFKKSSNFLKR